MDVPLDVLKIISSYITKRNMKLLDWVSSKVSFHCHNNSMISVSYWQNISGNPNAIQLLETYPDKINWDSLSKNPNAIHILEANQYEICWEELSKNPNSIHLLETNLDKINWILLSGNPNAINILKANKDKIDWYLFSENPSIFEPDTKLINENILNKAIMLDKLIN